MSSITIQDCEYVAKKYLKTENVQTVDFAIVPDQCFKKNFLIKITVKHNDKKKTLNFFAKRVRRDSMKKVNEILFCDFKETLPEFDPKITPKIYYGKPDVVLFEDLSWQGFKMHEGLLNLELLKIALEVVAKFHAGSFAYEEIKSKEQGKVYRLSDNHKLRYIKTEDFDLQRLSKDNRGQVEEKIKSTNEWLTSSELRKTLCHSNLTARNMMFKSKHGQPIECKLVNFKSKLYAPPVYDVLQLIFFNSTKELRQHHFDDLINFYYKSLTQELEKHSIDVNAVLNLDKLMATSHELTPLIKIETAHLRCSSKEIDNILLDDTLNELDEVFKFSRVTRENCYTIVRNKMGTSSYEFLKFELLPLDEVKGYLGDYLRLKIKIRLHSEEKTIHCFVKCLPTARESQNIVNESGCFFKEVFFYQTLVPMMQKLGISSINDCVSPCYYQRSGEIMIFEDFSVQDYKIASSLIPYNKNLLQLSVKKLAKYHASLMVFEELSQYKLNEKYPIYIKEAFFTNEEEHSGSRVMTTGVKSVPDVVNLFTDLKTEKNNQKFLKAWPRLEKQFYEAVKPSTNSRNVLCHGDLWTNNILLHFDGEEATDCRFVDFQTIRYCSPAHDLLEIVYLTTDRENRVKFGEEIYQLYYDELSRILASYNFNISSIYPHPQFKKDLEFGRPQILMQCTMYFSFCFATSEEIKELLWSEEVSKKVFFEDRKEYLSMLYGKSKVFRERVKECVMELYDCCNELD